MKGELSLTTVGKSVTYQGHTVEYYEKPLKKLVLPAKVQIGSLLINTLHDLLNKDGKNVLADNSSQSTNLTHVVDKIQNQSDSSSGSGGLLGSLLGGGSSKDSGGGDLLGSLKDSLHSRDLDLSGLLDDPDHLATVLKRFV